MLYRHCFSTLFWNTPSGRSRKTRLKFNGTHQFLAFAGDVNLLGDNIHSIKSTETLTDVSTEVGVEIYIEKSKYMLLSCHQNAGKKNSKLIV
jgi:hypothetical protein